MYYFRYKEKGGWVKFKMELCRNLNIIYKKNDGQNIYVDPRLELLAAVQINAEYPFLSPLSFKYKDNMKTYFSKFKNHKVVGIFNELFNKGFSYDGPAQLITHLSNDLELQADYTDKLRPMITYKEYSLFVGALKDYYEVTNFQSFYNDHITLYQKIVNDVAERVKENKIDRLEEFFGYSQNSYNIILSPVSINGGYGLRKDGDNGYDCLAVVGALEVIENMPQFYPKVSYAGYTCDYIFPMLIWHEFAHSYVNPLTEKFIDNVNKYSYLFDPLSEHLSQQGYGSWESFINEQIIEAIVSKIVSENISVEGAKINLLLDKEHKGLVYLDILYQKLGQYANNRKKYITFKDLCMFSQFIRILWY
jgi:hypothetical protein